MSPIWSDVRYAWRSLRRAPGFSIVALLTLALGIGGTTAIFSVVDGVLLRPLPYPAPARIVQVARLTSSGPNASLAAADFLDIKADARALAVAAGYREDIVDLAGQVGPIRVKGVQTTAAFFDVFGVPPLLGRTYTEAADRPGTVVAVIGEGLWRQQFGADPATVGRQIRLNGSPTEIVGVVAASFAHPIKADVWMLSPIVVPISPVPNANPVTDRDVHYFGVVARLRTGVPLADAVAELKTIGDRLALAFPDTNAGESYDAGPLADRLVADVRTALLLLFGSIGVVLLIACANVAGLLMARAAGRRREIAVRTALGAGRRRIVQQLLTESLVLALVGGALGLLVASWGLAALIALAPEGLPRLDEVTLDLRAGAFAFAASLVVGVLFGLTPALQASHPHLNEDLKDGGRGGTARAGLRGALVVAQVALALLLLIGAGLMLTSLSRLHGIDPGFRTAELVTIELPLPQARYDEAAQRRFYAQVLERLHGNPRTATAAVVFPLPLRGSNATAALEIIGRERQRTDRPTVELNAVSPTYFDTAGLRLLRGRSIAVTDGPDAPVVAVISATLAEREWPGQDPIGARITLGDPVTVVGVVSDIRRRSLATEPQPAVYMSFEQLTLPYMGIVVRSEAGAAATASAVRAAVGELDPDLPIGDVRTVEQLMDASAGQPRFRAFLLASFAGLALLLAAVGVYGLISFSVSQRAPELGLRLALGASPWQVFALVVRQGLTLTALGIGLGLAAAIAVTRIASSLLFATSATDPVVYVSLSLFLLIMAGLACYVPARRAMRIDPMTALRAE